MQLLSSLEGKIGHWAVQYRWPIIISTLAIIALSSLGLPKAEFLAGYRPLFNADDPKLVAFDKMEARFTRNDSVLIAISLPDKNAFSRESLTLLQEMTELAWQIPYASRVDSMTNFQHTRADGDDIFVGDLVEADPYTMSDAQLAYVKSTALNEPNLFGMMVSDNGAVVAINVNLNTTPNIQQKGETSVKINDFTQKLGHQIETRYPGAEIHFSGEAIMDYAFYKVAIDDSEVLVPLSMAVMLVIYMVLTRNIYGTFLTTLVIAGSIIIAIGSAALFGLSFHTGNSASPIIILTIAGASCVHLLVSFLHSVRTQGNTKAAIVESLRINFQPITITTMTSAIGFLAILTSDIPSFRVLSIVVATGVFSSLFLVIFFFPAMLSFVPDHQPSYQDDRRDRFASQSMRRLGQFVIDNQRKLLVGMVLINLLLGAGIFRNQVNDNWVSYFDRSILFRTATDFINDNLSGVYTVQFPLRSTLFEGIADPRFLQETEALVTWLEEQPEVLHVMSITNTFKRLNKAMHGDSQASYRLPDSSEEAAQYLLLYEMSLPYGLDLNNQVTMDKQETRLIANIKSLGSVELIAFKDRYLAWMDENIHYIDHAEPTGAAVLFAEKSHRNSLNMIVTASIALAGISLILMLVFGSIKLGLISLIPNLIPAALGYGLWGYMDGEISIVLSLVMTMTLGIVVDDTVHFLSKFLRARREKGMNAEDAVKYSFETVGQALLVTSLMLSAGFFLLTLSPFVLNADMGLLTGLVILFALLADFFFLPQLLLKINAR